MFSNSRQELNRTVNTLGANGALKQLSCQALLILELITAFGLDTYASAQKEAFPLSSVTNGPHCQMLPTQKIQMCLHPTNLGCVASVAPWLIEKVSYMRAPR